MDPPPSLSLSLSLYLSQLSMLMTGSFLAGAKDNSYRSDGIFFALRKRLVCWLLYSQTFFSICSTGNISLL
jgi:hypothetical protein